MGGFSRKNQGNVRIDMAKSKEKKTGKEMFYEYYSKLYGDRFESLKDSLYLEPNYFEYKFDENSKSYFLDSGSVLAALSLPLENAENVLDMCAAPGGKSLILAKNMSENSFLTSNEYSKDRYIRLKNVIEEHLPENVVSRIKPTCFDGATWCKFYGEVYDAILLDAPCSSERHVLNDEKYLNQWTPSRVKSLAMKQWALLSSAFRVLKPCGYLLYSTCALAQEENDGVIEKLLKKFENVKICDINYDKIYSKNPNLPNHEKTKYGYHVLPDVTNGAGPLYFCLIQKI